MTDAPPREPRARNPHQAVLARFAVLGAAVFAIAVPAVQALSGLGLSPSEFSDQGDETLRAASYAFSIWTLIYVGLIAGGIYVARGYLTPFRRSVVWPATTAIASCGVWIIASSADLRWLSVAVILIGAASASLVILRHRRAPSTFDHVFILWPLSLLAGWLTIASALNVLTVMNAEGHIRASRAEAFAIAGVIIVALTGLALRLWSRRTSYLIPIVWGLIAIVYAEGNHQSVALTAGLAALVLSFAGAWLLYRTASAPSSREAEPANVG